MDAIDPATGEQFDSYEEHTEREVDEALEQACGVFEDWRERPMRDRERLLESAAEVLRDNKREYAETMTREMGKPITQAVAEIEKCARCCGHYVEHASAYLGEIGRAHV